jgi:hypothetical protein
MSMTNNGLRLMVYDRTCIRTGAHLTPAWFTGSLVYRGLGRIDASFGASSWDEALTWLTTHDASRTIDEIQYWGHGRWGRVLIDNDVFDASVLRDAHAHYPKILALRDRLSPSALVWLRTCEAFGADVGRDFAQALSDGLRARVAGHTFIIGVLQSGLRALLPGCRPQWSASEGIAEGTAREPLGAHESGFRRPRTIHCLTSAVPEAFFREDSSER